MGFIDNMAGIVGAVQGAEESISTLKNTNIQTIAGANISSFLGFTQYLTSDFAGISMSGLNSLTTDVQTIITNVETIMTNFGAQQALWDEGLKGKAQADAIAYVETVKKLLVAYVTSLKDLLRVANEAAHSLASADVENQANIQTTNQDLQQISQNIESEANAAANAIDVDSLGY